MKADVLILGGGLAGMSASYHLGHGRCLILERNSHPLGHLAPRAVNGFTWDRGPHVSFTSHLYVQSIFAESVGGQFHEFEARVGNYYQGTWIDHPAQSNLYQIPEPLRGACLESFLAARSEVPASDQDAPANYADWLERAFGAVFANTFPSEYTRKYWTTEPSNLTTSWIGPRVFYPSVDDVIAGSRGPLERSTHYVKKVRYPMSGGYAAFANLLQRDAQINLSKEVVAVDLAAKEVRCRDGSVYRYGQLISTLPLQKFVLLCGPKDPVVLKAAGHLICSSLLIIDVELPCPVSRPEHWVYVYDDDKYATRVNFPDKLARANVPPGRGAIQVEVYFSDYRPLRCEATEIANRVIAELSAMNLIEPKHGPLQDLIWHAHWESHANVIFDRHREPAMETVLGWLAQYGLRRTADDLEPSTDWEASRPAVGGDLFLAGRFGQHKYYWTDDCVLRGREIAQCIGRP